MSAEWKWDGKNGAELAAHLQDENSALRAEVARLKALLKEAQPLLYDQAETASYFGNEPSDLHERIAAELAAPSGAADPEQ